MLSLALTSAFLHTLRILNKKKFISKVQAGREGTLCITAVPKVMVSYKLWVLLLNCLPVSFNLQKGLLYLLSLDMYINVSPIVLSLKIPGYIYNTK